MGDLRKRVIFVKWGILEEKMRDFRLNGGFAKTKHVIFAYMGDLRRENVWFSLKWGILEEKTRDFRVKWVVCEKKTRDFRLNEGFANRKRVILA